MKELGMIELSGFRPPKTASFTTVDANLWNVWLQENDNHSLVKSGTISVAEYHRDGVLVASSLS